MKGDRHLWQKVAKRKQNRVQAKKDNKTQRWMLYNGKRDNSSKKT